MEDSCIVDLDEEGALFGDVTEVIKALGDGNHQKMLVVAEAMFDRSVEIFNGIYGHANRCINEAERKHTKITRDIGSLDRAQAIIRQDGGKGADDVFAAARKSRKRALTDANSDEKQAKHARQELIKTLEKHIKGFSDITTPKVLCNICHEQEVNRVLTQCGHALCADCLENYASEVPTNEKIECPKCRDRFDMSQVRTLHL